MRLEEVRRAARMGEGPLLSHAKAEDELLMLYRGQGSVERAVMIVATRNTRKSTAAYPRAVNPELAHARSLLREALGASRKHFKHEERKVFPLIEKGMQPEALTKLGMVWFLQRYAPANWTL